jgi:hypothetical protein
MDLTAPEPFALDQIFGVPEMAKTPFSNPRNGNAAHAHRDRNG